MEKRYIFFVVFFVFFLKYMLIVKFSLLFGTYYYIGGYLFPTLKPGQDYQQNSPKKWLPFSDFRLKSGYLFPTLLN